MLITDSELTSGFSTFSHALTLDETKHPLGTLTDTVNYVTAMAKANAFNQSTAWQTLTTRIERRISACLEDTNAADSLFSFMHAWQQIGSHLGTVIQQLDQHLRVSPSPFTDQQWRINSIWFTALAPHPHRRHPLPTDTDNDIRAIGLEQLVTDGFVPNAFWQPTKNATRRWSDQPLSKRLALITTTAATIRTVAVGGIYLKAQSQLDTIHGYPLVHQSLPHRITATDLTPEQSNHSRTLHPGWQPILYGQLERGIRSFLLGPLGFF